MEQITNSHLIFLEEAKYVFRTEPFRETHRNEDGSLIALRLGADRDCIMIYELGEPVANFVQQIKPVHLRKTVIENEN